MKILAFVLIGYTAVMLAIHVSSWKLLRLWNGPGESWAKRRFSARTVLRVEALYWLLVLASWPFWPSVGWKAVVVVFAAIHLLAWVAGEARAVHAGGSPSLPRKAHRYIVGFDLVEAVALVAVGWLVVVRVLVAG